MISVYGYWKIIDSFARTENVDTNAVIDTEFRLTRKGNVIWKPAKDTENVPLFQCDVFYPAKINDKPWLTFGTYKGHILYCEIISFGDSHRRLIFCDGWCTFICERFRPRHMSCFEPSFHLLLECGYFSDLVIKDFHKNKYKLHKFIMKLGAPKLDWNAKPPPFSGLPGEILEVIIHYFYTGIVPPNLDEETLEAVISKLSDQPCLNELLSLCTFRKEVLFEKRRIRELLSDMVVSSRQMLQFLEWKNRRDTFQQDPLDAKAFCTAIKCSLQEGAIVLTNLFLICKHYISIRKKITEEEEEEIFVNSLSEFEKISRNVKRYLDILQWTFEKLNLAYDNFMAVVEYMVPKIEAFLDMVPKLMESFKVLLRSITSTYEHEIDNLRKGILDDSMESVFQKTSLIPLLTLIHYLTALEPLIEIKTRIGLLKTEKEKLKWYGYAISYMMSEFKRLRSRFDFVLDYLDNRSSNERIDYVLRIAAMKLNGIIDQISPHKTTARPFFNYLSELIERDSFFVCLDKLGLLDSVENVPTSETTKEEEEEEEKFDHLLLEYQKTRFYGIEVPSEAFVARLRNLLWTGDSYDVLFDAVTGEMSPNPEIEEIEKLQKKPNLQDIVGLDMFFQELGTELREKKYVKYMIRAHKIILISRWEWFEFITLKVKKPPTFIKIQDLSPKLVSILLEFLYTGRFDISDLSFDKMVELWSFSVEYRIRHLKHMCELSMKDGLTEENVFDTYNMADANEGNILKAVCEDFIIDHPDIVHSKYFKELPDKQKDDTYFMLAFKRPNPKNSKFVKKSKGFLKFSSSPSFPLGTKPYVEGMPMQIGKGLIPKGEMETAILLFRKMLISEIPLYVQHTVVLNTTYMSCWLSYIYDRLCGKLFQPVVEGNSTQNHFYVVLLSGAKKKCDKLDK